MRRSQRFLFALNAGWMGLSVMDSLHVLLLPAVLLNYVPAELKE